MKQVKKYKRGQGQREEARQKNQQVRRRRRKRKYMLYYILILVIVLTTAISLSLTAFFNIENIEVKNSTPYTKEQIISASGVRVGDNLMRTSLGEVEKKVLDACVDFDEVHASRDFPNTLSIDCVPASVKYCYQKSDGSYVYVSNLGRVMDVDQTVPPEGILVIAGKQFDDCKKGDYLQISADEKQKLDTLTQSIVNAGLKDITKIAVVKEGVEITYQDRIVIEITNMSRVDYMLSASAKIINEYIGVSERGEIFFDEANQSIHFLPNRG